MSDPRPTGSAAPAVSLSGNYLTFLRQMHRNVRPRTYLEIGVYLGDSIALAGPKSAVVGIDPHPKVERRLSSRCVVFEETSDDFFAQHDVSGVVGTIDVAFIDGLHRIEQVLRDFVNLERHMSANGVILVHDCYPGSAQWATRSRPQKGAPWAGDVWKLLPILNEIRPQLTVNVVAVHPTGIGVISGLDPSSTTLQDRHDEMVSKYESRDYSPWPNALPGRWSAAAHLFPAFRRRGPVELAAHHARRAVRPLRRALRPTKR